MSPKSYCKYQPVSRPRRPTTGGLGERREFRSGSWAESLPKLKLIGLPFQQQNPGFC